MSKYTKKDLGNGHYIYSTDFRESSEFKREGGDKLAWGIFVLCMSLGVVWLLALWMVLRNII